MIGWRAALCTSFLAARALAAGEVFSSDFEDGGVVAPDGPWINLDPPSSGIAGVWTPDLLRGSRGALTFIDRGEGDGMGSGVAVSTPQLALKVASVRTWVAVSDGGAVRGRASLLEALGQTQPMCDVQLTTPSLELVLGGADSQGSDLEQQTGVTLAPGVARLVECELEGLGTDAGLRRLVVDGREVARAAPLDFSLDTVRSVLLGVPFEFSRGFSGAVTFDDVRVADRRQASRLVLEPAGAVSAATCAPFSLRLAAWDLTVQSVPFDVEVELRTDRGDWFVDRACTVPMGSPLLRAGSSAVELFFRSPEAGHVTARALHRDFIFGEVEFTITSPDGGLDDGGLPGGEDGGTPDGGTPDGGTPDGSTPDGGTSDGAPRGDYLVGCGCDGGGAPLGWVLIALAGRGGRRSGAAPRRR